MKINGSLVFDASSASEIQNLRVQKITGASVPVWIAADQGRMIFATTSGTGVGAHGTYVGGTLYYGTDTAWVAIATGGNAAALQTEVDNIEVSLGSIVNTSGVWQVGAVTAAGGVTGAETNLTQLLQNLANYANANNELAELDDVTLTSPSTGQFLMKSAGNWVNHTFVTADVSDLTATAAELNTLDGFTGDVGDLNVLSGVTGTTPADISSIAGYAAQGVTATEFGYLDATSSIQTQLNNKQPLDTGLTALAAFNTNGIIVQTADDVYAGRTTVAPAAGVTITNPDGVAGNITFALADDLAGLEALATTGYSVRTGTSTWTTRTIGGTAGRVVVGNGDGVASNTDIDLATVTDSATGTFLKFTRDAYGRVSGTSAVVTADITALVDATYINVAGDSMASAANLTFSGGGTVTGLPSPAGDTDAANKAYVDALTAGLTWKNAVDAATVANGTLATAFAAGQVVDGVTLTAGMRVLLKDQTAPAENGIYVVQASGAPVRATDMDAPAEFDGAAVFVKAGTVNESAGFTQTATVATVGTDPVVFSQFSGSATYTWGIGLAATGNTINVNLGAGIAQLPSDEVGIDLFDTSTGAIILTNDGTTRAGAPATNSTLHLLLDTTSTGGLNQGALGLFIKAGGVTNTQLVNSTITINADAGTPDPVSLGETLLIAGTSAQGINTTVSGNTVTISAADATTASKGVASFAAADFVVTAGVVTIGSLSNAQLDNSSITLTGTAGSDAVSLGESLSFVGATSPITTSVAANAVTIAVAAATVSTLGLASFNADHFAVTAGAVDLAATLDDLTNVSSADGAATDSVLSKSAGDWVAVTRAAVVGSTSVGDHNDVTLASPVAGDVLAQDTNGQFVNKRIYFLQTQGISAATWTVTHNIGQKYCNVTVVDGSDEVVIPQSITFDSANALTVTFNTAITGKVIVMGMMDGASVVIS